MVAVIRINTEENATEKLGAIEQRARSAAQAVDALQGKLSLTSRADEGTNPEEMAVGMDRLVQANEELAESIDRSMSKQFLLTKAYDESRAAMMSSSDALGGFIRAGGKFLLWAAGAYVAYKRFHSMQQTAAQGLEANRFQAAATTDQLRELTTLFDEMNRNIATVAKTQAQYTIAEEQATQETGEFVKSYREVLQILKASSSVLGPVLSGNAQLADSMEQFRASVETVGPAIEETFRGKSVIEQMKQWDRQLEEAGKSANTFSERLQKVQKARDDFASKHGASGAALKKMKQGLDETYDATTRFGKGSKEAEEALGKLEAVIGDSAERLNNPPPSSHKLPTGLRETTECLQQFEKELNRAGRDERGFSHDTERAAGKLAKMESAAAKATKKKGGLGRAALRAAKIIVPLGAAAVGAAVGFGVLSAAVGVTVGAIALAVKGTKAWLQAIPEFEKYRDVLAGAQIATGETARETARMARELKAASGYAVSTTDALRQLSNTPVDLGFEDQLAVMKFAAVEAKRTGQDVASVNDQVMESLRSGAAEALEQLHVLPGGLERVAAEFDRMHGALGLFDKLTEKERQLVVQTEALEVLRERTRDLEDVGIRGCSALDNLKGAIGNIKEAWVEASGRIRIFGRTGIEWSQAIGDAVNEKVVPWIEKIPDLIQDIIDKGQLWVAGFLEDIQILYVPMLALAEVIGIVGKGLGLLKDILGPLAPGARTAAAALDALSDSIEHQAMTLAEHYQGSSAALALQQRLRRENERLRQSHDEVAKAVATETRLRNDHGRAMAREHELAKEAAELAKSLTGRGGGSGASKLATESRKGLDDLAVILDEFHQCAARAAALAARSVEDVTSTARTKLQELQTDRHKLQAAAEADTKRHEKEREKIHEGLAEALEEQLKLAEKISDLGERAKAREKAKEEAQERLNQLLERQAELEQKQADDRARQLKTLEEQERRITDQVRERLQLETKRTEEIVKQIQQYLEKGQERGGGRRPIHTDGAAMLGHFGAEGPEVTRSTRPQGMRHGGGVLGGIFRQLQGRFDQAAELASLSPFERLQRRTSAGQPGNPAKSPIDKILDSIDGGEIQKRVIAAREKAVREEFKTAREAILKEAREGRTVREAKGGRAAWVVMPDEKETARKLRALDRAEERKLRMARRKGSQAAGQRDLTDDDVAAATKDLAEKTIDEAAKRGQFDKALVDQLKQAAKAAIDSAKEQEEQSERLEKVEELLKQAQQVRKRMASSRRNRGAGLGL